MLSLMDFSERAADLKETFQTQLCAFPFPPSNYDVPVHRDPNIRLPRSYTTSRDALNSILVEI